jgi:hypothetical protein
MASAPVMAEDLYLVRFSGGKEVAFELTSRHARLVMDVKWEELKEVPAQTEHTLSENFNIPDADRFVGVGNARWFKLEEFSSAPSIPPPNETKLPRFELLRGGFVYDRTENRVLVLSCQGTIDAVTFLESMEELAVVNREVTGYLIPKGKIVGAFFSGHHELTFIRLTGEVVKRVPLEGLGTLFLDREDPTLIPLVVKESKTHWINPLNWLRTIAGHPKQTQRVTVSIFDSSGALIDSLHLTEDQDAEQFSVFKIIR